MDHEDELMARARMMDNLSKALGILHDARTNIGPMREVHDVLNHEWLFMDNSPQFAEFSRLRWENREYEKKRRIV